MNTRNSNPIAKNGLSIVEGALVRLTSQADYTLNGEYRVHSVEYEFARLVNVDGSQCKRSMASTVDFDEIKVVVR